MRLSDRDGQTRYIFKHESGTLLELRIKQRLAIRLEDKRIIARGDLMGPAIILAEEVQLDLNLTEVNPKLDGD